VKSLTKSIVGLLSCDIMLLLFVLRAVFGM